METKHQWTIFKKGRVKVKGCSCCGQMLLPSNSYKECEPSDIYTSSLISAGYKDTSKLLQSAA